MNDICYVFVIKLKYPDVYYWAGNPSMDKIIIPLKDKEAEDLKEKCLSDFEQIYFPIYGIKYRWAIECIEIWEKGNIIHTIKGGLNGV